MFGTLPLFCFKTKYKIEKVNNELKIDGKDLKRLSRNELSLIIKYHGM